MYEDAHLESMYEDFVNGGLDVDDLYDDDIYADYEAYDDDLED